MSKKIIVANWKMNPASLKEAKVLFGRLKDGKQAFKCGSGYLSALYLFIRTWTFNVQVEIGAQDVSPVLILKGAHTGAKFQPKC